MILKRTSPSIVVTFETKLALQVVQTELMGAQDVVLFAAPIKLELGNKATEASKFAVSWMYLRYNEPSDD